MNRCLLSILMLSTALASVSSHFILDYPPSRGFIEETEEKFCGGFPTNSSGHHPFPLDSPAPVAITAHSGTPQVEIRISFVANPTSATDFNNTSKSAVLIPWSQIPEGGTSCLPVNISSVLSHITPAPTNGTIATLQVQYRDGDDVLNQCSDLVLLQNLTLAQSLPCGAGNGSISTSSAAGSTDTSAQQTARSSATKHFSLSGGLVCLSGLVLTLFTIL